jgi:hypothetical protein
LSTTLDRAAPLGASPLPRPRGTLSAYLLDQLTRAPHDLAGAPDPDDDPVTGEDGALALYLLYELHYRGVDGVDEAWEWDPGLLTIRQRLERSFEERLRDEVGTVDVPSDIVGFLQDLVTSEGGRSVATWCLEQGELVHLREQAVHRSGWQLKEADPHSWALPRLHGRPKAALVEIQADEYGQGVQKDIHAELYALTMERLGLDPSYGAYLDVMPALSLSTVSLVSWFGLHRRMVGAMVGHLAVFEMASVPVMGAFSAALRRLGFDDWTRLFYDTHVVADAHHQTVAATELAGGLVEQDPRQAANIAFGALALERLEGLLTDQVLDAWEVGRTSLLAPLPDIDEAPGQRAEAVPADDPRDD